MGEQQTQLDTMVVLENSGDLLAEWEMQETPEGDEQSEPGERLLQVRWKSP